MDLLSASITTPFWVWLVSALATAYYYDVMKKRIDKIERKLNSRGMQ
jgi:hypothetical protein|tara:strand:+ start:528 stop:668 length:141 start_codon:yes stop_codon:yes gene_type:complete